MPIALKTFIVLQATNTWFQKASTHLPHAQKLQDYLSGLKELSLQKMGLPDLHIPENLFLKRYIKKTGKFSRTLQKLTEDFT